MALVIDDRVRETTTVTGTNDATLLGAVTGFQAFSVLGNGNTTYYTISDQAGGNWECGIGTYSSVGPTLERTTVLTSSNSGSKVSFPAGTKDVFVTYPSEKAVYLDESGNVQPALGNVVASQVNITAQGDLRLEDTSGGQYVALQAPGTVATSYTLTLPVDDGTNGQALITDGNGVLSWSTAASGDVYGPASATDNAVARFDGTTGKIIQNSAVTIADTTGDITTAGYLITAAGAVGTPALTTTGDTNTGIFFPAADTIAFTEGGVESMRITSAGNVGINTTSPAKKLQVQVSGEDGLRIGSGDPNKLFDISYDTSNNIIKLGSVFSSGYALTPLTFWTNQTERMRIAADGNVGIGVSNPAQKLQVVGTILNYAVSAGQNQIDIGNSRANDFVFINGLGSPPATNGYTVFGFKAWSNLTGTNTIVGASEWAKEGTGTDNKAYYTISTHSGSALAEHMRIDSSGNVGIGTSSPSSFSTRTLEVFGSSSSALKLTNTGNTGSSSGFDLEFNGNTNFVNRTASGVQAFWTNSTERMRITDAGNLLVGTTTSDGKLTVDGGSLMVRSGNYIQLRPTANDWDMRLQAVANQLNIYSGGDLVNPIMALLNGGNVGIGTSSPSEKLTVSGNASLSGNLTFTGTGNRITGDFTNATFANRVAFQTSTTNSGTSLTALPNGTGTLSQSQFYSNSDPTNSSRLTIFNNNTVCGVASDISGTGTYLPLTMLTGGSERLRIDTSGNLLVGKTTSAITTQGCSFGSYGAELARDSGQPLSVNRRVDDGTVVSIRQGDVEEGTISVSGSTVSYNGGHLSRWSQLPDGSKDETIVKGTVLTNLDDMCVWEKDGVIAENEQLNKMKVSDVEGDTNVAGVFVNWTMDEKYGVDDMNVAMTGDMIIRIADGVVVQKGDLLMSAGDGTSKPQGDDIVRSKTIAKVTSNHVTCTYADGSYCVPCVLMAC
jgi:hypothetical protein